MKDNGGTARSTAKPTYDRDTMSLVPVSVG
jgi:hypothetical protein